MPAITETEADKTEAIESDTEVAAEDDPDAAEPLTADAVLMA